MSNFQHFSPFNEIKTINFYDILNIVKECSFWEYFNSGYDTAELYLYFDNEEKGERIIYNLYFDLKKLKISRCTGWNGKKYTKGGGALYTVANIKSKGRAEFDKYMEDFCMTKYGYKSMQVLSNLKY